MTDQNQNTTSPTAPEINTAPQAIPTVPNNEAQNMPQKRSFEDLFKEIFNHFKGNKKLVIGVSVFVGVLLLIVISGTIYSVFKNMQNKGAVSEDIKPVPTQEIILTETSKTNESKLKELKDVIIKLDSTQKHLTPPVVKFDISF